MAKCLLNELIQKCSPWAENALVVALSGEDTKRECTGTSDLDGDHCVGGKPSCADGFFDNGDCVSDELPQCTPPKTFKNGQCVEIHVLTCYPPFVFDPVKNTCVDVQGPRCPQGQVYQGGKCVFLPDQDCLEYEWCPA
ncbi:hypothetical protein IFM61606_10690 [Aspergillus udagawae]|nr:hypothetical protein IFM61606_10690 [Aspergillus udagawae]